MILCMADRVWGMPHPREEVSGQLRVCLACDEVVLLPESPAWVSREEASRVSREEASLVSREEASRVSREEASLQQPVL